MNVESLDGYRFGRSPHSSTAAVRAATRPGTRRPRGCPSMSEDHHDAHVTGDDPIVNLPEGLLALLRQPSPCHLATLMADGSPHVTQTWVDTDGKHVLINSVEGFQKIKNV